MKIRSPEGFTLLELMVGVMILSVLVAVAMATYGKFRDRAAMLVDETNEKVLLAAAKLYAYDKSALPGNLSQLRPQDIERAYAMVTEGKRSYTFLAFLQERVGLMEIAEAVSTNPIDKYLTGSAQQIQKIKTCPMDPNPPASGGVSYGIVHPTAAELAGGTELQWLLNPNNADAVVIVETDALDGSVLKYRHEGNKTCIEILNSGVIRRGTQ